MTQLDISPSTTAAREEPPTPQNWLRLPCCDTDLHPVEITRHESARLEITVPTAPHGEAINIPDPDEIVHFSWAFGQGAFILSCRVEVESADRWILVVQGDGEFVMRRRHARVATTAPAQLLDHRRDVNVPGTLLDLSEGGMRCVFDEWLFEGGDDSYRIAIRLDGAILVVEATPMWSGMGDDGKVFVGFEFGALHHSILTHIRAHVAKILATTTGYLV